MNQERLYQLFEKSIDAIVIFDTFRGIQYANPPALELLDYEKQQLNRQPLSSLLPSSFQLELDLFITSPQKFYFGSHIQIQGKSNVLLAADIGVQRLSRQDKAPAIYLATIYPKEKLFSPLQHKEQSQKESPSRSQQLLSLLKAETDMPLSSLTTLVERLLAMHPRNDQLPLLHDMQHAGQRLQIVVEHIQLYDELIHDRIHTKPESFKVIEMLNALESTLASSAKNLSLTFTIELIEPIPPFLSGDIHLIIKTMKVLLDTLAEVAESNSLKLEIRYNASNSLIGSLDFIFGEVSEVSDHNQSLLGLSIVNLLASQLTARISIVNHHVKLCLPCTSVEPDPKAKEEDHQPSEQIADDISLSGLRLLYVENLIPNHFLMEGLCSIWGVNLDTAQNGREALDSLQNNQYDVILMDLRMPILNGYQTTQIIRQPGFISNSSIPIIAISGSVSDDTLRLFKEYGINDHLLKPIKPDELYQKLLSFVSS